MPGFGEIAYAIDPLEEARGYCTDREKCDILTANMGGSAITLSRVCAILPARRLAVAAALLLLAPVSLFGRELDFRGQKVTVEGVPMRGEEGK